MRWSFVAILAPALNGCGTYVPDTQDFPGNQGDQQLLVQAVVKSVRCEVANAISDLYDQSKKYATLGPIAKTFDTWGVQMTLSLKTEERGTLNPTVIWTPPAAALFSLSAGATLSSDATRTDKLYFYYRVRDLKNQRCQTGEHPEAPVSSPLIQPSLKFGDWLYDVFIPVGTNLTDIANGALKAKRYLLRSQFSNNDGCRADAKLDFYKRVGESQRHARGSLTRSNPQSTDYNGTG
jgi:hypothetical protein